MTETLLGSDRDFHRAWREWWGMPEYSQEDLEPFETIRVHFASEDDVAAFEQFVGDHRRFATASAAYMWYPPMERARFRDMRYRSTDVLRSIPRHPIYIVSKGRWRDNHRLTSRALHDIDVRHFIVVEPHEVAAYREASGPLATILALDPSYQREYDTCLSDRTLSPGSGPARNFAWDHAQSLGAAWHWTIDDNIRKLYRLNHNAKIAADGTLIRCMEAFAERYENVAMVGPHYESIIPRRQAGRYPPLFLNTRVYSFNLIRTDLPFRWRGRYNEDTDLSLRMMKAGWATVVFNAFLVDKIAATDARSGARATRRLPGGNTDELYADGTEAKSRMLVDLHPDVATMIERYGRAHHHVDYSRFQTVPRLRPGVSRVEGVDDFGMILERRDESGTWTEVAR